MDDTTNNEIEKLRLHIKEMELDREGQKLSLTSRLSHTDPDQLDRMIDVLDKMGQ